MDDPWGSPWSSADTPSNTESRSQANTFLSPPPRAFFGNATGTSPWSNDKDDDGFNDWTTAESVDGKDAQNEWGIWAESGAQTPRLSPRLSVSGKESPLAWPENAAASPAMLANSRSRTPSFRHRSPDPWASELPLSNDRGAAPRNPLASTASNTPTIEAGPFADTLQVPPTFTEDGTTDTSGNEELPIDGTGSNQKAKQVSEGTLGITNNAVVDADHESPPTSKPDTVVHELPSRPSSTSSLDSHRAPERQDSPITSIDEDRISQARGTPQVPPKKVQELVGIYDGLARAASVEPPAPERRDRSQTRNIESPSAQDNAVERDDVRLSSTDVTLVGDGPDDSLRGEARPDSELSSTPKAEIDQEPIQAPQWGDDSDHPAAQFGPKASNTVSFDTNLGALDELFPGLPKLPEYGSIPDSEVSEHVISDGFATISERKAWYRISRCGSMRKHNSGDDENYHPVTWQTSHFRTEAITIVRRWMEQDSYAGKATLGGIKRTGFFDWDSDVAPVELDKIFRRRRESAAKHDGTASIAVLNTGSIAKVQLSDQHPYRNPTGISLAKEELPLPPVRQPSASTASFGWSSEAQTKSPTVSLHQPDSRDHKVSESADRPAPLTELKTIQASSLGDDEDEDDWGEMVSSPQTNEFSTQKGIPPFPDSRVSTKTHAPSSSPPPLRSSLTIAGNGFPSDSLASLNIRASGSNHSEISVPHEPTEVPKTPPSKHDLAILGATPTTSITETHDAKGNSSSVLETFDQDMTTVDEKPVEAAPLATLQGEGAMATNPPTPIVDATNNESEENEMVQEILRNLPDLSYML
ncbi:hypothetical protein GGS20DRAFT_529956 [Poronia punctata]|nr:hypothetical protein GGS20DRAFT_529956 [Poronia punctata]